MSVDDDDSRTHGIDFGDLDEKLEDHDYPADADEIREAYGDEELGLPDGSTTLGEVLEGYSEEFEDAEAVRQAVLTMVEDDAIGREDYSDRGSEAESAQESEDKSA
ncbi:DUF5789 family protein [Halomarina litorea]|uniref:DUF5789 family protein n=1 Tax=Halomarina litorea TaxID=2961595 RepID=UPI0020C3B532|nr:hypothetical protein [Halomarina sp. BCD28]